MMGFHDLFVSALFALVFACVIAKFVLVAFYGDGRDSKVKVDANKVVKVVEHVNLGNALKVRRSRSKKRVTFVDDVVVRHVDKLGFEEGGEEIGEEVKRVVFSGEEFVYGKGLGYVEGVVIEAKGEKDEIFKCFDEKNVNVDEKNLLYSDEWNKGVSDEVLERGRNDIDIFYHHLSLEEENSTIESNTRTVEMLKCVDEQRVNEEGKVPYTEEKALELGYLTQEGDYSVNIDKPFSVNEEKLQYGNMDDLTIEVIKEETSTSGSVFEGLMVDEKMNNEGFSSQSRLDFVSEHSTLDLKEDNLAERVNENVKGGLSERDEEVDQVEVLGENMKGGLRKNDEGTMKNDNVVVDEEDDDWEGIERTKLEKVFAKAVNYVEFGLQGKDDQLAKLGSEVQMQLYGLHKIAVEGSCHQAQPMALNFFARAKWNAWQKLGSMSPEVAMEEYIKVLIDNFPEWVQHFYNEDGGQSSLESALLHGAEHRCSLQDIQPNFLPEPELKLDCVAERDYPSKGTNVDTT